MSEQIEDAKPELTLKEQFAYALDSLQADEDAVIRVRHQWWIEQEMLVNAQGDLIDGPPEEADSTRWMCVYGPQTDKEELARVLAFRKRRSPEDNLRILHDYIFTAVEETP